MQGKKREKWKVVRGVGGGKVHRRKREKHGSERRKRREGENVLLVQKQQAQLTRSRALQDGSDGDEVLQGLGHLQAVDVKMARVNEVVGPLNAVEGGGFICI